MITYGTPIRTVAPTALPVSLAEFKAHLRIEFADEDAIMMAYLRAAIEHCENHTSMGFITQTWTQIFSAFPNTLEQMLVLGRKPLQEVISISYLDSSGVSQALSSSVYRVAGVGGDKWPSSLWLAHGQSWPATTVFAEAITVTYKVGYGDNHNSVPELIRQAIMMLAATLYAYREDLSEDSVAEIPLASKVLLQDWRLPGIA